MKEKLKKFADWLIWSSANPEKLGLSLKSGLALLALVGIDQTDSEALENGIVAIVVGAGQIVSSALLLYGIVRKLLLTFLPEEQG